MKTAIQIFFKQTVRGKKRLILNTVLLFAVAAMFVLSVNLYHNSTSNLRAVENAYTTLASVAFYGDVDSRGNLVSVTDPDHMGHHLLNAAGYDLSRLLALDPVTGYDLRYRCAAYIPGAFPVRWQQPADNAVVKNTPEEMTLYQHQDVIRFMILGDEPIELPLSADIEQNGRYMTYREVDIQILDQVLDALQYPTRVNLGINEFVSQEEADWYADDIRRVNRSDDTGRLILYPGVEYIASVSAGNRYWSLNEETGKYEWTRTDESIPGTQKTMWHMPFRLGINSYDQYTSKTYDQRGEKATLAFAFPDVQQPFFIQRLDDVLASTEEAAYWTAVEQAAAYSGNSFGMTLTNDITGIPAWYAGGMYLNEGRMITEEEYASGAKVCMVSALMAEYQGWKIGDMLDLHFYPSDRFANGTEIQDIKSPFYTAATGGFFDTGAYQIVGIYGQTQVTDLGDALPETFYQPWDTICVPTRSVSNLPDQSSWDIRPHLLTIKLQNGSVNAFQAAVEELGLMEQKTGQYELKFSYFDQGYEKIKPGLDEMHKNAKLLLGLSAALLAVTMVLTAFLFAQQHKHSAGILRMLGGSKKQAFVAILACAAAVVAAGGVIGTILGGVLTQSVGASTLGDAAESAKVALSTGASPVPTMLSGLGCMALFLLLVVVFTTTYIGKEPRALLPEAKG